VTFALQLNVKWAAAVPWGKGRGMTRHVSGGTCERPGVITRPTEFIECLARTHNIIQVRISRIHFFVMPGQRKSQGNTRTTNRELGATQCLLGIAQQLPLTLINSGTRNNAPQPHHLFEFDLPGKGERGFMMMTMTMMRILSSCWLFYSNAEAHMLPESSIKML